MTAVWHQSNLPSWFGAAPQFSFSDLAEVHQVAPIAYEQARADMRAREIRLGPEWFRHNAYLGHKFFMMKKAWWM